MFTLSLIRHLVLVKFNNKSDVFQRRSLIFIIKILETPPVPLQFAVGRGPTGGAVSQVIRVGQPWSNRSLFKRLCFYACAVRAVCPVSLVDFYLRGEAGSFGSPAEKKTEKQPVGFRSKGADTSAPSLSLFFSVSLSLGPGDSGFPLRSVRTVFLRDF